jgi:glycosyltransferase involved in cell wall biosynthesis
VDVLHLYSGNLFGGVERLLVTLASAAPHHRVALGFDGRLASELRAAGRMPALLGPVRFRSPSSVVRARRALHALLGLQRPDVVVCHSAWAHALFAGPVRRAGLPLAFFLHDLVTGRHWLERLARRHPPDLVLANSALTSGTVPGLFEGAPTEVVTLPLPKQPPAGDRTAVRAAEGVTGDEPVVVVASRLASWKGHSLLLDALAHVPADVRWKLWVVGGPRADGEAAWLA